MLTIPGFKCARYLTDATDTVFPTFLTHVYYLHNRLSIFYSSQQPQNFWNEGCSTINGIMRTWEVEVTCKVFGERRVPQERRRFCSGGGSKDGMRKSRVISGVLVEWNSFLFTWGDGHWVRWRSKCLLRWSMRAGGVDRFFLRRLRRLYATKATSMQRTKLR